SITGAYVALYKAFERMVKLGILPAVPLVDQVAAVSCGLYKGAHVLDLDYIEDSAAEADTNFVLTGNGGIVEIQATAEERSFTDQQFHDLMGLARKGVSELCALQRQALGQD
ncbi:MAG: ribonuclease PH, partial [Rhodospirillales bacterium]|nr:ribonuclease PH [Rhodospirillales bacterium]